MNYDWRRALRPGVVAAFAVVTACSPGSLVDVDPSSTIVDPGTVANPFGATQLYYGALSQYSAAVGGAASGGSSSLIQLVGAFTDELMTGLETSVFHDLRDGGSTADPFSGNHITYRGLYSVLHQARVRAHQAREALRRFHPAAPPAWHGRLYAIEAHAILWLAELYCSGIPLTTVPLDAPGIPTAGLSTQELLERAIVLFDSAIVASGDTARFANFARVGMARALLQLGRFTDAATAAQAVPTDFVYTTEQTSGSVFTQNTFGANPRRYQMVDSEGGNGLVWSSDPRTAARTHPLSGAMWVSAKYSRTATGTLDVSVANTTNPVRVADGLEARLIEAEADLANSGSNWLTILNTLRSTCFGAAACAPVPGLAAMAALPDPGTPAARLDLLMSERAKWLYLTGHRQGDLRRLARVYLRDPVTLWPTGTYTNAGFTGVPASTAHGRLYGGDLVWGLDATAEQGNPLFSGCNTLDP